MTLSHLENGTLRAALQVELPLVRDRKQRCLYRLNMALLLDYEEIEKNWQTDHASIRKNLKDAEKNFLLITDAVAAMLKAL